MYPFNAIDTFLLSNPMYPYFFLACIPMVAEYLTVIVNNYYINTTQKWGLRLIALMTFFIVYTYWHVIDIQIKAYPDLVPADIIFHSMITMILYPMWLVAFDALNLTSMIVSKNKFSLRLSLRKIHMTLIGGPLVLIGTTLYVLKQSIKAIFNKKIGLLCMYHRYKKLKQFRKSYPKAFAYEDCNIFIGWSNVNRVCEIPCMPWVYSRYMFFLSFCFWIVTPTKTEFLLAEKQ